MGRRACSVADTEREARGNPGWGAGRQGFGLEGALHVDVGATSRRVTLSWGCKLAGPDLILAGSFALSGPQRPLDSPPTPVPVCTNRRA